MGCLFIIEKMVRWMLDLAEAGHQDAMVAVDKLMRMMNGSEGEKRLEKPAV